MLEQFATFQSTTEMGCGSSTIPQEAKPNRAFQAAVDTDAYASVSEILQRSENKSMVSVHTSEASTSTRWHAFPSSHLRVRYGCVSQRGQYPDAPNRENQDRWVVHVPYGGNAEQALFGVFDGHGENGTQCAAFAAVKVCVQQPTCQQPSCHASCPDFSS